ncbi:FecR domain-containing protein [Xanthomonas sacchari]|uniref:FecR domain-containing protein n=1 Tax=Xanthomonas sacchari TaxID=56458 RepID=UPI0020C3D101|nr:FecR domain-containing protein [Xanthomonas sacchari]
MRPEPAGAALDPRVLEQAVEWLVRLGDDGAGEAEHAACARWRAQHPDHARAWARVERLHDLIAAVPATLARPVLDRPSRGGRRAAIKSMGALLLLAPGAWLGWQWLERSPAGATLQTAVGERRRLRLDDASLLELDTDTALQVAFDAQQRLLRLRHGRILVTTAADPQRPARAFRVTTADGALQALGTRFEVRADARGTGVVVLEGAVLAQPGAAAARPCRVPAGQALRFDRRHCGALRAIAPGTAAWTRGMLVADAWPLADLLRELGRYRRGVLRCDPALAGLRVSGAFPLDDPERSLALLEATYPVRVRRQADGWWTTLAPRERAPTQAR